MRRTVRAMLRAGADWIKLATTGGLVSDHDQPLVAEFTREEIEAAVFEASRKGKHVARARLRRRGPGRTPSRPACGSIEHGGFLTEEQAARMARARLLARPDAVGDARQLRWAEAGVLTPTQCKKILDFGLDLGGASGIAKEYGVPLASAPTTSCASSTETTSRSSC